MQNLDSIKLRCVVKGENITREVVAIDYLNLKLAIEITGCLEWRIFDKIKAILKCTGIEDSNEKLIFQGDIVKIKMPFSNYENRIVAWDSGIFYFSTKDEVGIFIDNDCEIIGNKFEHPHLLPTPPTNKP